jgi:transcriptional regulator with PAS, ATPase and Fis domain
VRQLRHFVEQLLLNRGFQPLDVTLEQLYQELLHIAESPEQRPSGSVMARGLSSGLASFEGEKERIMAALEECRFNKTKAAGLLGLGRTTLWRKMKELGLG